MLYFQHEEVWETPESQGIIKTPVTLAKELV